MTRVMIALVLTFAVFVYPPIGAQAGSTSLKSNASTPQLTYHGGPMIQHPKVFLIFYSAGYPYKNQLIQFYTSILNSSYIDMLQEYDQPAYQVRRGSYAGLLEDTNANPMSVTSIDPQAYLSGLLTAKKVPPPDDDTLYALYLPSGIDSNGPFGNSCVTGGTYCAYHYSFALGGQKVYYAVIPDIPDYCDGSCGPTGFDGLTSVSSHELVEALTDPDIGPKNYAYKDDTHSGIYEIGDICTDLGYAHQAPLNAVIGGFTVQTEWSNLKSACIATNPLFGPGVTDMAVAADMTSVLDLAAAPDAAAADGMAAAQDGLLPGGKGEAGNVADDAGGTGPGPDAGTGTGGTGGSAADSGSRDAHGCSMSATGSSPIWTAAVALILALAARRRRGQRRRRPAVR